MQLHWVFVIESMDFENVVKKRWMCRKFKEKDVPSEKIEKILQAALKSPSAGHTQPQEYIVIRDQKIKEALGKAALGQMFIAEAPVIIAVVSDKERSAEVYGDRGRNFYSITDGAFSSMLILLSAVSEGLGAAFVAAFDDESVSRVLGLPGSVRPIGLIPIGHCAEKPKKLRRIPRDKILHSNKYQGQ